MPLTQLNFQPGLDTENTETGAEGRWTDCDKIRFRKGLPQKIGGWTKFSEDYYVGRPSGIASWISLDGTRYQSIGGDKKVYIYQGGSNQDITPIRQSNTLTSVFTTTNTSSNVIVNHATHGADVGSFITISNVSANVGGITTTDLENQFEIISVNNVDAYTIATPGTATSTVTDSSNADITYQINPGPTTQTFGYGWSAGTYSESTWNTPRTSTEVTLDMRQWSLNNCLETIWVSPLDVYYATDGTMGVEVEE